MDINNKDHKGETMTLNLPEDLLRLWDHMHCQQNAETDKSVGDLWQLLQQELMKKLALPDGSGMREKEDAVADFMTSFIMGRRPEGIASIALLRKEMRKYLAQKRNPVQYELQQILHEALLALEKDGAVRREQDLAGYITGYTQFVLNGIKSPQRSEYSDYERHCAMIPTFSTRKRANDWEKTRMITLTNAKALVLHLLEAFGGWTRTRDLLRAMQNHMPEQLTVESLVVVNEDGEEQEKAVPDYEACDYMYDHDFKQVHGIAQEVAERIWMRVQKISDKALCLYWLPKNYFGKRVKLEDAGPAQTVFDQCKKFAIVFQDELDGWEAYAWSSLREKRAYEEGIRKISLFLRDCCTEKGYPSDLYANVEKVL